jgi:hypothetical protein
MSELDRVILIARADRDAIARTLNHAGSAFRKAATAVVDGFANAHRRALEADPTIGRKRRARRARGKRRQPAPDAAAP